MKLKVLKFDTFSSVKIYLMRGGFVSERSPIYEDRKLCVWSKLISTFFGDGLLESASNLSKISVIKRPKKIID